MSAAHTHLVVVSCDEEFAAEIMDAAPRRGATYSVAVGEHLARVRRGERQAISPLMAGIGERSLQEANDFVNELLADPAKRHTCGVLDQLSAKLAERNTKISYPIFGPQKPMVETVKLDEKKRGKALAVFAAYCPFCGAPLDPQR